MPPSITYADLRAAVYPRGIPAGIADELPGLYNSLFSTVEWFESYEGIKATGACVLNGPRHVLLFAAENDTIEVLNKVFEISPCDAERACRALLRALPDAHRIHFEVMFRPEEMPLPKRVLYQTDHMVIDLPHSVDEYLAGLGKKTRGNLRNFENRLRREHPDVDTQVLAPGERTRELLEQLIAWKNARFAALGRESSWNTRPEIEGKFEALMSRCCEAHVTTIDGSEAAIRFVTQVGTDVFAVQGAFDPLYGPYRLGSLSQSWVIRNAIERGARRVSLLWGHDEVKRHQGARPARATRLSVFPSHVMRLHSLGEAAEVLSRRFKTDGRMLYECSCHGAGGLARRFGLRAPAGSPPQ